MFRCVSLSLACSLLAGAAASAQSLSTGFSGTTFLTAVNSGNFFDITALSPTGITIDSWEVHSHAAAGTPITVDIYVKQGTSVGSEQNALPWGLLGSFPTTAAGVGVPTPVAIGGLHIPASQTYGVRVAFSNGGAHYNTAATTVTPVVNGDAQIDMGSAQSALFTGALNTPRGWNGTINYTLGNTTTQGGCCLPDGTCAIYTEALCTGFGGTYRGNGTDCVNPNCPPPGACCFSATFTCQVLSQGQCTTAGGVFQGSGTACASCPPPAPGSVAIVAAAASSTTDGRYTDVRAKLMGTGLFPEVVIYNATQGTPTLGYVQQFDAVITWSNVNYDDSVAMGNVLADYVDAGGGVVVAMYGLASTSALRTLGGRWDLTYEIIPDGVAPTTGAQTLGAVLVPGHPIMNNVNTFAGGTSSARPTPITLAAHGVNVAEWSDGKILVATSTQYPGRVDLGMYPPSSAVSAGFWTEGTDGAILMANALRFAGGTVTPPTCYANCDNSTTPPALNVADFTCFLQKFAAGDSVANCDNSTTVPILNVADFTCFLQAFAAGCP